ncbi:hypothetical protein OSB04_031475 [Centaurea solstitialis]|uniref:DUF4218 domain-containing protein n=1 Tax=Centaurea solstitialis TaxID=347529 RepID=A0AA38VXM1_9ASTR|nr:hypothetical protein OSB04_031475 [Centaurea solstitialis]
MYNFGVIMYPFERYMKKLKNYVKYKARPKGSITEGYVAEEALTFYSMYLRDVSTRFNRPDINEDAPFPTRELHVFQSVCTLVSKSVATELNHVLRTKVEWFVLNNSPEIDEYMTEFTTVMPGNDLQTTFPNWFKKKINQLRLVDESHFSLELHALANGLTFANTYTSFIVNGVRFVVHSRDTRLATQNSGVSTPGPEGNMYCGLPEEILELVYLSGCKAVLFRCKWFRTDNQCRVTKNNITSISTQNEWYKEDQYILATQANQVFLPSRPV